MNHLSNDHYIRSYTMRRHDSLIIANARVLQFMDINTLKIYNQTIMSGVYCVAQFLMKIDIKLLKIVELMRAILTDLQSSCEIVSCEID